MQGRLRGVERSAVAATFNHKIIQNSVQRPTPCGDCATIEGASWEPSSWPTSCRNPPLKYPAPVNRQRHRLSDLSTCPSRTVSRYSVGYKGSRRRRDLSMLYRERHLAAALADAWRAAFFALIPQRP
ncbi:hypothetical protein PsYK624_024950 [Phanerochaete sordida]|uniref:Uncharacterized protein n=1 Tax=Phanerochaete sordida TaxID=48140 RepID=A0A9P3G2E0_9APHY|nr:hypothetical protein PsYK624_024950 [Phanerochaete sordida]